MGDKGGRPPLYTDPVELDKKVTDYFKTADENGDTYRITALALHLGMCSKNTLYEYAKKPGFQDSLKMAFMRIEDSYVGRALTKDKVTGEIFLLKCSYGYKESSEIDLNHGGQKDNQLNVQVTYKNVADKS